MEQAGVRKYAGLPDVDSSAPDIFETPELTEDTGTTTAARTPSRRSSGSDGDGAIDRQRLNQDEARARFLGSRVDARAADFSDRLAASTGQSGGKDSGATRSYVVRNSRHRRRQQRRRRRLAADGDEQQEEDERGDYTDSDDEDEDDGTPEGLRRKLARLNREAAELRADVERMQLDEKASGTDKKSGKDGGAGATDEAEVRGLEASLGALAKTILRAQDSGAQTRLAQKLETKLSSNDAGTGAAAADSSSSTHPSKDTSTTYTIAYAPSYDSSHALARAAAFDSRLAALEALLGLEQIPLPSQEDTAARGTGPSGGAPHAKPVLPTLDILDKQLSTLAATTGAGLDAVGKRVAQLTRDAEKLADARRAAKEAHEQLKDSWTTARRAGGANGVAARRGDGAGDGNAGAAVGNNGTKAPDGSDGTAGLGLDDPELVARVNALHGALPTIEALAPVVPGLLDRLRSLRLIHADAAGASKSLAELERRQDEVDEEMAEWRESLANVESLLQKGEAEAKGNMAVVENWVEELEKRVKAL